MPPVRWRELKRDGGGAGGWYASWAVLYGKAKGLSSDKEKTYPSVIFEYPKLLDFFTRWFYSNNN